MANFPVCLCGSCNYEPGGGSFGGATSTQWHTCRACKRVCVEIHNYMTVFVLPTAAPVRAAGTHAFPQEGFDYINGPLDVTMRAYGAEVEEVHRAADRADWNLSCELLGLPRDTKIEFREPSVPGTSGRYMKRPDGSAVEDPDILKRFDAMSDLRRQHVRNDKLVYPITPPKVPDCLTIYLRTDKDWCAVDHAYSATLAVPPDPRRVAHDKFFAEIFAKLRETYSIPQPTEIPNRYYDDKRNAEPWYTFGFGQQTYVVGPRKRVYSITVENEVPVDICRIRDVAARDNVSYWVDDVRDSESAGWKSEVEVAKKVTIHAYGGEKLVEYLSIALGSEIDRQSVKT